MGYSVKYAPMAARFGTGFAQGLSEQVPKEIERYRLASGLKNFEQESGNLTPMQQLARLSSIPGVTPQMIQSFSELAKQQNTKNAFINGPSGSQPMARSAKSQIPIEQIAGIQQQSQTSQGMMRQGGRPNENVKSNEFGQPQIMQQNPLRQEAIPKGPWTPQQKMEHRKQLYQDYPNLYPEQIEQLLADDEAREVAQPKAEQEKDAYLRQQQENVRNKFQKNLELKLQKKGEEIFGDIPGEMVNNLVRSMEKELRTNPNATEDDVVNRATEKALDLAKTKTQIDKLANRPFYKRFNPFEKKETFSKLKSYQKIFDEANNKEEYFNLLKEDFNLSPGSAASIAYDRNNKIKEYTKKYQGGNTRKYASDISKMLTSDDSLLAIARDLLEKDSSFDESEFWDELRQNQNDILLNPRQMREIAEGELSDVLSWEDLMIMPLPQRKFL